MKYRGGCVMAKMFFFLFLWVSFLPVVASEPVDTAGDSGLSSTRKELATDLKSSPPAGSRPPSKDRGEKAAETKLSPLGQSPSWSSLEVFQKTISKSDFHRLLDDVYAPDRAWAKCIKTSEESALIGYGDGKPLFRLDFARRACEVTKPAGFWRPRQGKRPKGRPLQGLRIALDPGHLGGEWARTEKRWYQIGDNKPVTEGDMTLEVARILCEELRLLGAEVSLTREDSTPSTHLRPVDLRREAKQSLESQKKHVGEDSLHQESEKLFYRTAEIRARANKVNKILKPDLVLALHFNAEPWGNANRPVLVSANHLHVLVTGGFTHDELAYEDQLHAMLVKLLSGCFREENALALQLAESMSKATGLPPYLYKESADALRLPESEYVWARNLLANRLFECPVIYLEPYVMNNRDVHARVQEGDYEGRRKVNGQ